MIEWKQRVEEVTSIWRQSNIEKSTWKTLRYFVDFESRTHVEISTSNRCHNFYVDSPFRSDVISMNFPRGISTSNRWRIDEDGPIGLFINLLANLILNIYIYIYIYTYIALVNLSICYAWSDIKSAYNNNKFRNSSITWNDKFELPPSKHLLVFKTSSRRLQDMSWRLFNTSSA